MAKELLLKDLCARLPYGVKVHVKNNEREREWYGISGYDTTVTTDSINKLGSNFKPYLRSMSSMTEEEKRELSAKYNWNIRGNDISIRYHSEGYWDDDTECPTNEYLNLFDWLNEHNLDYRGLIEKGLALEAPEGMYKTVL